MLERGALDPVHGPDPRARVPQRTLRSPAGQVGGEDLTPQRVCSERALEVDATSLEEDASAAGARLRGRRPRRGDHVGDGEAEAAPGTADAQVLVVDRSTEPDRDPHPAVAVDAAGLE